MSTEAGTRAEVRTALHGIHPEVRVRLNIDRRVGTSGRCSGSVVEWQPRLGERSANAYGLCLSRGMDIGTCGAMLRVESGKSESGTLDRVYHKRRAALPEGNKVSSSGER